MVFNEYLQNFFWSNSDYNKDSYAVAREHRRSAQNSSLVPTCQQITILLYIFNWGHQEHLSIIYGT